MAQLVVEHLGRGAGQRVEAGVAQLDEEVADRLPAQLGAVLHLLGREGVQMQRGRGPLDGAHQLDVEAAVETGRQARLDAHLGGADVARLDGAADDLLDVEEVAFVAALGARERAEAAGLDADVGEVDVAVDDVGDLVADLAASQLVGDGARARAARGR